jgi:transcriptional antiterminator Rof (Rho-off)
MRYYFLLDLQKNNLMEKKYNAINCGFYDNLELLTMRREKITITYLNDDVIMTIKNAIILDLSGGSNGEYAHVKNGDEIIKIRLDYLISAGNINLNNPNANNCRS